MTDGKPGTRSGCPANLTANTAMLASTIKREQNIHSMSLETTTEGEATPKYTWAVPSNFEGYIDDTVAQLPERQRQNIGRAIAFAFHVGFESFGIDPTWQSPQLTPEVEQPSV